MSTLLAPHHCKTCNRVKPFAEFYLKANGRPTKRKCKSCITQDQRDERVARGQIRRRRTPEENAVRRENGIKRLRAWSLANASVVKAARKRAAKRFIESNRAHVNATNASYRAYKRKGTLPGYDVWLEAIYATAQDLGLTVDHVYPLKGKNSCGLHVPWNLQLLSLSRNSAKRNSLAHLRSN